MKAAIRRAYCEPQEIRIEETDDLIPTENEALIKVHYTTVNRTDCANLTAKPWIMRLTLGMFKPRTVILGTDFSGEVVAIGNQIETLKVGDRVFGFNDSNAQSQAEKVAFKASELYRIPNNIEFGAAAAALEGAHYAYSFIKRTNIRPNHRVLINGATGAIGSALLQFVKERGAEITATCRGIHSERVKVLGASKTIDYEFENFTSDETKYHFVFDAVGKSSYLKCKRLLTQNGIYISSELGPYGQNVWFSLLAPLMNQKAIFPIPFPTKESIPFIQERLTKGSFVPMIDREYNLSSISEAYTYAMSGHKLGNVLLKV